MAGTPDKNGQIHRCSEGKLGLHFTSEASASVGHATIYTALSTVGSDVVSAWRERDIRFRSGVQVFAGLGVANHGKRGNRDCGEN
jgi:hypothetical protein